MHISKNIRHLRKSRGLSQEALGKELDKTKGAISSYEKGVTYPSLEVLLAISKLFEVSIDDLIQTDLTKIAPTKAKGLNNGQGLSEKEKVEYELKLLMAENAKLKKEVLQLLKDKELNQDQIKKLWELIEEYRKKI